MLVICLLIIRGSPVNECKRTQIGQTRNQLQLTQPTQTQAATIGHQTAK